MELLNLANNIVVFISALVGATLMLTVLIAAILSISLKKVDWFAENHDYVDHDLKATLESIKKRLFNINNDINKL